MLTTSLLRSLGTRGRAVSRMILVPRHRDHGRGIWRIVMGGTEELVKQVLQGPALAIAVTFILLLGFLVAASGMKTGR